RHVWSPAPCACAKAWQCASAPASPPRSPPLPSPLLVTKKPVTDLFPPIGIDEGALPPAAGALAPPRCCARVVRSQADSIKVTPSAMLVAESALPTLVTRYPPLFCDLAPTITANDGPAHKRYDQYHALQGRNRFGPDDPGRSVFHCRHQDHLTNGLMA